MQNIGKTAHFSPHLPVKAPKQGQTCAPVARNVVSAGCLSAPKGVSRGATTIGISLCFRDFLKTASAHSLMNPPPNIHTVRFLEIGKNPSRPAQPSQRKGAIALPVTLQLKQRCAILPLSMRPIFIRAFALASSLSFCLKPRGVFPRITEPPPPLLNRFSLAEFSRIESLENARKRVQAGFRVHAASSDF